jgi:hypothetical protein
VDGGIVARVRWYANGQKPPAPKTWAGKFTVPVEQAASARANYGQAGYTGSSVRERQARRDFVPDQGTVNTGGIGGVEWNASVAAEKRRVAEMFERNRNEREKAAEEAERVRKENEIRDRQQRLLRGGLEI